MASRVAELVSGVSMGSCLNIATRRSALALAQAALARSHFEKHFPEHEFKFLELVTTGDRQSQWSLERQGGKGLFTKELEEALLSGEAWIAVHSSKDLPTELPEGLALAGFLPRATPNDVLIRRSGVKDLKLIATSSPRRRAQGKLLWPNVEWTEIRGNVETRLRKIADGEADATLLAAAGLERLGITSWPGVEFQKLDISEMVPAAGQAAIGIECRTEDVPALHAILDDATYKAVMAERRLLDAFGGGCHTAVAAHWENGQLHVFHDTFGRCSVAMPDPDSKEAGTTIQELVTKIKNETR